ncbi:hypothetical protein Bca52824_034716 [Brassica carinata]|uniref:Uncharacterized protein n=1 Tax=Brassica carinata TaxID=52824 RepID=A0A8X7V128_BRACI|nr:hypothetical protein Bca52824_034716 [Brassica carinata]
MSLVSSNNGDSGLPLLATHIASVQTLVAVEPDPIFTSVKTFAPATVANLDPGFDLLGCAVDGLGDHVTLRVDLSVRAGEILISEITGTRGDEDARDPFRWVVVGSAQGSTFRERSRFQRG